jgi:hypothetical protein
MAGGHHHQQQQRCASTQSGAGGEEPAAAEPSALSTQIGQQETLRQLDELLQVRTSATAKLCNWGCCLAVDPLQKMFHKQTDKQQ